MKTEISIMKSNGLQSEKLYIRTGMWVQNINLFIRYQKNVNVSKDKLIAWKVIKVWRTL